MILFPAIDLKDGRCVRLVKGDMNNVTVFNDNPAAQAKIFADAGFSWIHIVDLNGAFEGTPVNIISVQEILNSISIPIQLGGGIRNISTVERWIDSGVSRIILGTAAIKDPVFVAEACKEYPGKIAVGIDARKGFVAVDGWAETSEVRDIDLARRLEDIGVNTIIYTDIDRDGLLGGLNIPATVTLAKSTEIPVIASGGVSSVNDLINLKKFEDDGISGAISGRAIYDGRIDYLSIMDVLKK